MATVADLFAQPAPEQSAPPNPTPKAVMGDEGQGGSNPFDQFDAPAAAAAPQHSTVAEMLGALLPKALSIVPGMNIAAEAGAGAAKAVENAGKTLADDAQRYYKAQTSTALPKSPLALVPGMSPQDQALGSVVADTANLAAAPVAGATDATVVQPAARVLDKLPAPQQITGNVASGYKVAPAMTPEQQHAANENIISTALMAAGPKGIRAGAITPGLEALADEHAAGYAAKVAGVVNKVPAAVALDETGLLTPEAQEHAIRAGVHPEDVQTAYEAVRQAQEAPPPAEAAAPAPQETPTEPAQPSAAAQAQPEAQAPPSAPAEPAPDASAAGAPDAVGVDPSEPLPAGAAERLAQAKSEGIDLSRGQATQSFDAQSKEDALRGSNGPDANAARQFFARQAQQISDAVDRFKQAFGNPDATAADRGQVVRDALTSLRDSGKAGVSALYNQARQLAEGMGDAGSNLLKLNTQPLLDAMRGIMIDETVPEQVRSAIRQQAAQYGLIGGEPRMFEDGTASVRLRDASGEEGPSVVLPRPPEPLTITNAEDLRQKVNQLYQADTSKRTQALKGLIDTAVQEAVERAADEGTGDVGQAFKDARAAHAQQQQTFAARDTVQKVISWKKGTEVRGPSGKVIAGTPEVLPENIIKTILGSGKDAVTELKKVKAILLSKPTEQSRAAWAAIKAQAVENIFGKALTLNANMGEGMLGTISGAKLNSEIARFGAVKLKVLLSESEFNQLMKLRRIIGDATIPIQKTTNPSGSGYAVMRFLGQQGLKVTSGALRFIPGVGHGMDAAAGLYKIGKEAAQAKDTLQGIEGFDEAAAAKADARKR